MAPPTTHGPVPIAAAPSPTGPTAGPASPRATTRVPARTRAAQPPGAPTGPGATAKPTTRAPAPTDRLDRDRTCTAAGAPPPSSAATSGPRPRDTRTAPRAPLRAGLGRARAARRSLVVAREQTRAW